ncbi:MAG TPA: PA14 domain-containing protein, partial [Verrucomicrobiae bacterium]|nr:PA14 domain-containing protein [Verrucomicrobiae bacterium]
MPEESHVLHRHGAVLWFGGGRRRKVGETASVVLAAALTIPAASSFGSLEAPAITNVAQLRQLASQASSVAQAIVLEGAVWWASRRQGRLVLQDWSGAAELEMDCRGTSVASGQRVRVQGYATIARRGASIRLGANGAVVDNDGIHAMVGKSGAVYLSAGRQPIRVEWFNGVEKAGLELQYEGPGVTRQRIPDQVLFRASGPAGAAASRQPENGLEWRCYEGTWEVLPEFGGLTPVRSGVAANLDLSLTTRAENVALQFSGELEILREGLYTFHLASDDGSSLYVGRPTLRLDVIGQATLPEPRRIAIGQVLRNDEAAQWAAVEGLVTFLRPQPPGLLLELSAGAGHVRVEVADASGLSPADWMGRRARAIGFCQSAMTTDGYGVTGVILTPGAKELERLEDGAESSQETTKDT